MKLTVFLLLVACGSKTTAPPAKITDGIQITYGVDLDAAVDDKANEIKRTLRAELARASIEADVRTVIVPLGGVNVIVDPARRAEANSIIKTHAGTTVQARACETASAICIRITDEQAMSLRKAALEQTVSVIRKRIASGAVRGTVAANGETVVIDLAGSDQEELSRARDLIARVGRLQLVAIDDDPVFMKSIVEQVKADELAQEKRWLDARIEANADHVIGFDRERLRRYFDDLARMDPRFAVRSDRQIGYERVDERWRTHYLFRDVGVSGRSIKTAGVQGDKATGTIQIALELDSAGAAALAELTAKHKRIATLIDSRVRATSIAGTNGRLTIPVGGTATEATELAAVLRSPLPAAIREETLSELRDGKVIPPPP